MLSHVWRLPRIVISPCIVHMDHNPSIHLFQHNPADTWGFLEFMGWCSTIETALALGRSRECFVKYFHSIQVCALLSLLICFASRTPWPLAHLLLMIYDSMYLYTTHMPPMGYTHVPRYTATKNIDVRAFTHCSLLSLQHESLHEWDLRPLLFSSLACEAFLLFLSCFSMHCWHQFPRSWLWQHNPIMAMAA